MLSDGVISLVLVPLSVIRVVGGNIPNNLSVLGVFQTPGLHLSDHATSIPSPCLTHAIFLFSFYFRILNRKVVSSTNSEL